MRGTLNTAHQYHTGQHRADRPMTQNPFHGKLVYILLLALALTWATVTPLCAAEPGPPTPMPAAFTATPAIPSVPSTPQPASITTEPHTSSTAPAPNAQDLLSTAETETPTATLPPPTATPTNTPPGTAHLAVLVSECVVPVGGAASSEVLVHLEDVRPGIVRLRLVIEFDPQVVHVQDADNDAGNGTQIGLATFFDGTQRVVENLVDNAQGKITLTLAQGEGSPVEQIASWAKLASIVWIGQRAGNSSLRISEQSRFTAADGQAYPPSALHHGTAFVRLPGQIRGRVELQGRTAHGNTLVTSSLSATRTDRSYTELNGSFAITVSHGEGFYTLSASAAGYLTAIGDRPIKLTVGSEIELEPVTLLGGDVNGDNRIDIRDLSYVAYHLDAPDAQSDVNGDAQVDILDLTMIAGNFGTTGPTTWPISD